MADIPITKQLEDLIARTRDDMKSEVVAWIRNQPRVIQELVAKYPWNIVYVVDGKPAYAICYTDGLNEDEKYGGPGVMFSFIDGRYDYIGAANSAFYVSDSELETILEKKPGSIYFR